MQSLCLPIYRENDVFGDGVNIASRIEPLADGNRGLGEGGWGMSDREDIVFDVYDFATA